MFHLFNDKDSQKLEKFELLKGAQPGPKRNGLGSQIFENGCNYSGMWVDDMANGKGRFTFPEQSVIEGFFQNNRFVKGQITLSVGIVIGCLMEVDPDTQESFMRDFSIKFQCGYNLTGATGPNGFLEMAALFDCNKKLVAEFRGEKIVIKVPETPETHIIVSKLWVYEGGVTPNQQDAKGGANFNDEGVQVWFTGIGYNKGYRVKGCQEKTQFMLRHSGSLQFFREIEYKAGKLVRAFTVYNNGIIFVSEDDYFKGFLKFYLQHGREIDLTCTLSEYSTLRSGTIFLEGEDGNPVKFSSKNNRLVFSFKGKEYNVDDFKDQVLSYLKPCQLLG